MYVIYEVTSKPTRPFDNVVITTKSLQDRNIHILDGTTMENKGKLILTFYYIFVSRFNLLSQVIVRYFIPSLFLGLTSTGK